jgi:hypothetical protein
VVVVGLAVTVGPVVVARPVVGEVRPVAGDQEKVAFGLLEVAVRLIEPPAQIVEVVGATLTVGAPTVTVTVLVKLPQSVFARSWYVVVAVGATLTEDAVESTSEGLLLAAQRYEETVPV